MAINHASVLVGDLRCFKICASRTRARINPRDGKRCMKSVGSFIFLDNQIKFFQSSSFKLFGIAVAAMVIVNNPDQDAGSCNASQNYYFIMFDIADHRFEGTSEQIATRTDGNRPS